MKTYGFSNATEREEKKQVAQKINAFIKDNKLKYKNVKNILNIATQRITMIKQMDLSRFDVETLEGFLEKLKGASDE